MDESYTVSPQTCSEIRTRYSYTEGLEPLQEAFDIDVQELRAHLYGDCAHEIDTEPLTPPVEKRLTPEECSEVRRRAAEGEPISEIAEQARQSRKTVARHAFGDCSHEISTPAVDPSERAPRNRVDSTECATIRSEYKQSDTESVLEFSESREYRYETFLRHIRGDCSHEVSEPPVEGHERAVGAVEEETCRELRTEWRNDTELGFVDIAEQFGLSVETVERHIKFLCAHDYEHVMAEEMESFSEYFDEGE